MPKKKMSILASACNDLKFYQWPDGVLQQTYLPANYNDGPIKSISWGKDGTWVVVVPHSGPAEVVSIKENVKLLQTIHDIYNPTCATFQNSTKKNIAVGTLAGQILVYDIKARAVRKRFPRGSSKIFSLIYNAKDTHVAAGCTNGEVLLYNNATSNLSSSYRVPKSETVSVINFHRSKRNFLAAGSEEGIIATWDINTNKVQCSISAHQAPITDLTFSPIRSDLLVTSGLDRRFSFYDLLAKKCILEVEVASSVTSLDFSYCGMYLGLGSQNGNIILYDTRNLSKSISAFSTHEGKKIHHLSFQKVPVKSEEMSGSTFDLVSEDLAEQKQQEDCKNQEADSLGLVVCDDAKSQINEEFEEQLSHSVEDSFLAAMGLENSPSELSVKQETTLGLGLTEEVKKWMDATKHSSFHQTQEQKSTMQSPVTAAVRQISSTPKYLMKEPPATSVSPIVGGVGSVGANGDVPTTNVTVSDQLSISPEGLKQMVRDVVKEELETYKEEMRVEFAETLAHMRHHFLDLQMFLVKEFVAMETRLGKSDIATVKEFVCDDFLINQNNRLLKEVEALKEQIGERRFNLHRKY